MEVTSLAVLPAVAYTNLIMIVVAGLVFYFMTRYLYFKIRQPLLIFHNKIRSLSKGNLTERFGYRKGDPTIELADRMNQMTSSLNAKVRDIQSCIEKAGHRHAAGDLPDEVAVNLNRLQQIVKDEFKLQ